MLFADTNYDDIYNYDFLSNADKNYVDGFREGVKCITNLFEGNLDVFESDLNFVPEEGEKQTNEVYAATENLEEILEDNQEIINNVIETWAEMEINEIVTSFIDSMPEEEFEANREKCLKENPDKYYDTLYYAFKNKKRIREV